MQFVVCNRCDSREEMKAIHAGGGGGVSFSYGASAPRGWLTVARDTHLCPPCTKRALEQ